MRSKVFFILFSFSVFILFCSSPSPLFAAISPHGVLPPCEEGSSGEACTPTPMKASREKAHKPPATAPTRLSKRKKAKKHETIEPPKKKSQITSHISQKKTARSKKNSQTTSQASKKQTTQSKKNSQATSHISEHPTIVSKKEEPRSREKEAKGKVNLRQAIEERNRAKYDRKRVKRLDEPNRLSYFEAKSQEAARAKTIEATTEIVGLHKDPRIKKDVHGFKIAAELDDD